MTSKGADLGDAGSGTDHADTMEEETGFWSIRSAEAVPFRSRQP